MRFLVLMFSFLQFIRLKGQIIYEFGSGNASWVYASAACKLATPRINFTEGEIHVGFGDEPISMKEGEEAWLGYILDSVVLQSAGCMPYDVKKEPRLATFYDTGADPGVCFSACRGKGYIGLMNTKCFCFQTLPTEDTFRTTCQQTCSRFGDEAACGGTNVISLYKQADGMSASNVVDFPIPMHRGRCVMYDRNSKVFHSAKCTMSYRIGCQSMHGDSFDIGSRTVTWLEMTRFCFSVKHFPYAYKGALEDEDSDANIFQMWTGMVKARMISKNLEGASNPHIVGYIRVENGKYKLHFSTHARTDVKRFICQEGTTTTVSAQTDVHKVTVNPDVTVTAEPEPEPVAEGGPGNLLPLYIIIPIAVIVIAIVIVLLIIRMRRKKRNRELKSKWSMKTSQGKMKKKRKNSLTEGSHLCHENVGMYDITAEDNNPANKKDRPTTKQKPFKRNANPNFSNNLNATVSLDNVLADIDTFANDTFKTDNKKSSAFDSDSTKQLMDKDGETSTKKVVDDGKPAPQADVTAHDADKADNEYARINKVRKVSAPKIDGDGQMYDKLGDEKKDKNVNGLDPNYDRVKLDGESYNTTSKPMTVPDRDKLYDGLSRF